MTAAKRKHWSQTLRRRARNPSLTLTHRRARERSYLFAEPLWPSPMDRAANAGRSVASFGWFTAKVGATFTLLIALTWVALWLLWRR